MKIKVKLHPLLQSIYDALPEEMRERIQRGRHYKDSDARLDLPPYGSVELIRYDRVEGVMLYPRGSRPRRFPLRKDGSVSAEKIAELAATSFNDYEARRRKEEEEKSAREVRLKERQRLDDLLVEQIEPGSGFEVFPANDCLPVRLRRVGSKTIDGSVRLNSEGVVDAVIPFTGSVEQLNEILRILGEQS